MSLSRQPSTHLQVCSKAAVIGGGLLGLEGAKALYDLGMEARRSSMWAGPKSTLSHQHLNNPAGVASTRTEANSMLKRSESPSNLVNFGPHLIDIGPNVFDFVPILAGSKPIRAECGRCRANLGRSRAKLDHRLRTSFGLFQTNLGQLRPFGSDWSN